MKMEYQVGFLLSRATRAMNNSVNRKSPLSFKIKFGKNFRKTPFQLKQNMDFLLLITQHCRKKF